MNYVMFEWDRLMLTSSVNVVLHIMDSLLWDGEADFG